MEFPEGLVEVAFTINFMGQSKTPNITFTTCIAAESWAEWHLLHLAENGSQIEMLPDIGERWSIVERRRGKSDSGCFKWEHDQDRGSKGYHERARTLFDTWRPTRHHHTLDLEKSND